MLLYVIDREMNAVATMSNDIEGTMYLDDTSGGQTITLTSGCAIGSYDFKTDPYHKDSIYIKAGNFIVFTDKYDRTRMYTIMTVDGDDELDVHCEDIGLDLINEMANSWSTGSDQTLDFYLNQVIGNSSWKVVYESAGLSTQTRNLTFDNNTDTNLTRLESIMSSFGFECDFQVTMQWMEVKSMEIHVYEKLYNRSEQDIAQTFIDSLNLVSLTRSESLDDLYTAVLPTGGSADGKTVDISDIVYDDGQYFTTKGDNVLYDRKMAQKWNRYSGTPNANNGKYDYIYGHYSSSTTSAATLFEEALADLKEHHDVKLSYEAELLDLDADLGDYITIVDHTKQQDIYLKARIQEVTNYYSISGADKGTLANYTLMSSTNGDNLREILSKIGDKVSALATTTLYFTLDTQGSYAPIKADWSEFKPLEIPDGYWMWIKTVKVYQNGVEEVTYTSTKDQIDYVGPETVLTRTPLYFLSTSPSEALKPDGSAATDDDWTESQPSFEDGKYFWSREKVVWSAGTVTLTWALYDRQMTEAYQKAFDIAKDVEKANEKIIDIQNQVDGVIETWTSTAVPTLNNYPASNWSTDDEKAKHIGDLCFDQNNHCYRFMKNEDGTYEWKLLADSDVTKAVEDAKEALDAVDNSLTKMITEFYASTSPTELKGGSWSEKQPTWTEGNYIWFRTKSVTQAGITTYSNPTCIQGNTGAQGEQGEQGEKGDTGATGATGATGNGIKSTAITYQASTSGTTVPTGTWSTSVPTVSNGQYLWTKTVVTYTNSSTTTSYSVGYKGTNGTNGAAGNGIKSTSVTYQAGASGTTAPTGTWSTSVPTATASAPYIWTKLVATYTNGSTTTSYSVGCTPEGIQVGGRNLALKGCFKKYGTASNTTVNDDAFVKSGAVTFSRTAVTNEGPMIDNAMTFIKGVSYVTNFRISFNVATVTYIHVYNGHGHTNTKVYIDDVYKGAFATNIAFPTDLASHKVTLYYTAASDSYLPPTDTGIEHTILQPQTDEALAYTANVSNFKTEIGNKPTDWSPAPEDLLNNINDAQNTANGAADAANKAQELATEANTKADANSELIDGIGEQLDTMTGEDGIITIANKQAQQAQKDIDDFKLYIEHGLEADFSKLNKQIVAAGDKGVMIYDSENSQNYAHITNKGMDIYVGNNMVASFQEQSTIQNLVIRHKTYFGNHLVTPFTVNGEAGTAFFWDSTAQS